MMKQLKLLFVSAEVAPFAKTGGLADFSGSLPKALKDLNHDIRIIMPKYGDINERKFVLREVIRLKEIEVPVGDDVVVTNVKSSFLPNSKVQVYFVGSKKYFQRTGYYVDPEKNEDWPDNAERFSFFSMSALEILKKLHWQPDIIHCNDWQTALIPYLLNTKFKDDTFFSDTKTVLSIHNLAFQGIFKKTDMPHLLDEATDNKKSDLEFLDQMNFLKAGILNADILSTVSKTYAKEIQKSDDYGFGLQDYLKKGTSKLSGIVNGIDYKDWNPETDKLIEHNYSKNNLDGKLENKQFLVESQGMTFKEDTPVIGIVSRIADQKGFDILIKAFDDLFKLDIQMILLGTGEKKYEELLEKYANKYPAKLSVNLKFDEKLAHQIEAGADMFLMPSKFEPCGLNQLYSLSYGTIPIVRATGGLADTIKDFSPESGRGYGFVFQEYSSNELLKAVKRTLTVFKDKETWNKIMIRAMKQNFSWEKTADKYLNLYQPAED